MKSENIVNANQKIELSNQDFLTKIQSLVSELEAVVIIAKDLPRMKLISQLLQKTMHPHIIYGNDTGALLEELFEAFMNGASPIIITESFMSLCAPDAFTLCTLFFDEGPGLFHSETIYGSLDDKLSANKWVRDDNGIISFKDNSATQIAAVVNFHKEGVENNKPILNKFEYLLYSNMLKNEAITVMTKTSCNEIFKYICMVPSVISKQISLADNAYTYRFPV